MDVNFGSGIVVQPSREETQDHYLKSFEQGASAVSQLLSDASAGPTETSFNEWFAVRRRVSSSLVSPEAKERYLELLEASMPPTSSKPSGNMDGDVGPTDISFEEWFTLRRRVRMFLLQQLQLSAGQYMRWQ